MTLISELRSLVSRLETAGWNRVIGMQLIPILRRIQTEDGASDRLEVVGRLEALIGILEEFIQEAPPARRLTPVLGSAGVLADLLELGPRDVRIEPAGLSPANLGAVLDRHASVSVASPDGAIIAVNSKFCALSGYSRDELIGRNHRLLKSARQLPVVAEDLWRTISSGGTWRGELENRRKDGRHYWLQATLAPILDEQGRVAGYLSIGTDITEQKRRLAEQQRHARLLNLQRQTFQQFIRSQDLAAVFANLLEGLLSLTESTCGFIMEVRVDTEGLCSLEPRAISGMTWETQSRRWREDGAPAGMELGHLDRVLGSILRTGEAAIVVDLAEGTGPVDLAEGQPPRQAFLGMPIRDGEAVVAILGLANRSEGYGQSDADFLQTLSTTYLTLIEAAAKKDAERSAIDAFEHGHTEANQTAQIRAAPGEGAVEPATPLPASVGAEPTPPGRRRILVAEDHLPNQVLLRMQIEALGHSVDIAADGAIALAKWKAGTHDLLLADLNMPDMDGQALTRSIRAAEQEQGGHLPIIAITSTEEPEIFDACRAAGMDDILPKPIELDELRRRLDHWLSHAEEANAPGPAPTRKALSAEAVLDRDYVMRILGDIGQPQLRHLLDLFTASARAELRGCRNKRRAMDAGHLALTMHTLKSSARMVGALHFAALAERLEGGVETGLPDDIAALISELEYAVDDVEAAACRLEMTAPPRPGPAHSTGLPAEALPGRVLVLDDDELARRQTSMLLDSMGIRDVLMIANGEEALAEIGRSGGETVDLLITDLNMPGMDGIELLRGLAERDFSGDLIISSGVDQQVLETVAELVRAKGLPLRGVIEKPMTRESLARLLTRSREPPVQRIPVATQELSPSDILEGIREDAFSVYFQPKVDTRTLRVCGVEALARWWRDSVPVRPDVFIGTAERHCLIAPLSSLLLAKTLRDSARLVTAGFPISVAFNLSPQWLSDINLPERILELAQSHGFPLDRLILEITETSLLADLDTTLDVLTRLRLKGLKLSIDDFGTGYASMEQLQRLPVSELKIDRSFVQGAAERPTMRAILASSIDMARKLRLTTVAEGVETQADLDLVRGLGCDLVQGWLIARAMPIDELLVWLRTRSEPAHGRLPAR
ncbi:EAL domain-containing protein [Thiocystis violacea]|uniref:EAL domain-containing protein n=1 Tax=Thiocystis violacea TaxID=13725 RepID=UPI001F5BFDB9|nr:EAL domain-containing protein [Thiocystis violacea]